MRIFNKKCDHEADIIKAYFENDLTDAQKAHIRRCRNCQDAVAVYSWMKKYDDLNEGFSKGGKILPSAGDVLIRARNRQASKIEKINKMMKFLKLAQGAVIFCFVSGAIFLIAGKADQIKSLVCNAILECSPLSNLSLFFSALTKSLPFLSIPFALIFFLFLNYSIFSFFYPEKT